VDVPAGIDEGMQIRLAGEGDAGGRGGPPGDLYLSVTVRPHPMFRRDKANLLLDLPVNVAQAALGTTTEIPMLDGSVESISVPSGVQPGTVLRVKQKGVPNLSNGRRGDLLVRVQVVTPERLGNRARTLLRELADVLDEEDNGSGPKSWLDRLKETFKGEDD
jgi:molecular chaperone DnaJ